MQWRTGGVPLKRCWGDSWWVMKVFEQQPVLASGAGGQVAWPVLLAFCVCMPSPSPPNLHSHAPLPLLLLAPLSSHATPVQLLATLVRQALAQEQLQGELSRRVEALAAGEAGEEDSDGEGGAGGTDFSLALQQPTAAGKSQAGSGPPTAATSQQATPSASAQQHAAAAGLEVPASSAGTARSSQQPAPASDAQQQQQVRLPPQAAAVADWAAWLQQRRLGLRRPLGFDLRGRRYWCFGHQAGAFRLYIEEEEGKLWGWYEGEAAVPRLLFGAEGVRDWGSEEGRPAGDAARDAFASSPLQRGRQAGRQRGS
jgi:hypothetical protein